MKIVIPDEKAISWNDLYKQGHWKLRSAEAARVHLMVRGHLDPSAPVFKDLVDIEVRCYYPTNVRPDSDNVCAKLYIDGLIPFVIKDDDYKHVHAVTTISLLDRDNPRLEIIIKECICRDE